MHAVEKNWCPFYLDNTVYLVYSPYPHTIVKLDISTGSCKTVAHTQWEPSQRPKTDIRGGTSPIELAEGLLSCVHERVSQWEYQHRFMLFQKRYPFNVVKASGPFVFNSRGDLIVEFASSALLLGEHLLIAYGEWDREAKLAWISISHIQSLLVDVRP